MGSVDREALRITVSELGQAFDQPGEPVARPGPLTELRQGALVHVDDDHPAAQTGLAVGLRDLDLRVGGGPRLERLDRGLLLLVGFTAGDDDAAVDWMAEKVAGLRLFADDEGRMNLSLDEVGGAVLVVSQFTL